MVGRDEGDQLAVWGEAEGQQAAGHTAHLLHLTRTSHAHLSPANQSAGAPKNRGTSSILLRENTSMRNRYRTVIL